MLKRIGYTAGGFVLIGVLAVAILWGWKYFNGRWT